MDSTDCAVCQCDMGTVQYKHSEIDTNESETVVRLRCGHAFHGNCLALSLRSTGSCPMCRDQTNDHPVLEITLNDLYESYRDVSGAYEVLRTTRLKRSVQEKRKELNNRKKKFNEKISVMQSDRKHILREALNDFRRKHRDSFDRVKRDYQKALSDVRNAEYQALVDMYGNDVALDTLGSLDATGMYSVRHLHADLAPFRNSFWK